MGRQSCVEFFAIGSNRWEFALQCAGCFRNLSSVHCIAMAIPAQLFACNDDSRLTMNCDICEVRVPSSSALVRRGARAPGEGMGHMNPDWMTAAQTPSRPTTSLFRPQPLIRSRPLRTQGGETGQAAQLGLGGVGRMLPAGRGAAEQAEGIINEM